MKPENANLLKIEELGGQVSELFGKLREAEDVALVRQAAVSELKVQVELAKETVRVALEAKDARIKELEEVLESSFLAIAHALNVAWGEKEDVKKHLQCVKDWEEKRNKTLGKFIP